MNLITVPHYGLQVQGDGMDKRKLLARLNHEAVRILQIPAHVRNRISAVVLEECRKAVYVLNSLRYENLCLHLCLSMSRLKQQSAGL